MEDKTMSRYKQRVNERLHGDASVRRLTDEELKTIHALYLDMMEEFFAFCRENDIYVTLGGGSVLGAVRHQGFIPWDDDVDMHISRQGIEKLKQVFPAWAKGKYVLRAPNYLPGNQVRMGQVENPRVVIEDYTGRVHGLVLDLFIMENVPDNGLVRYLRGMRSLAYTAISGLVLDWEFAREDMKKHPDAQRPALSREQRIRRLIGRCFSFRSAEQWINRLDKINQYPHENTSCVNFPTGAHHYFGEIYKRENMANMQLMPFEGHQFPVPVGYDAYLRQMYGDYMQIPPEKKREHHFIRSITFNL